MIDYGQAPAGNEFEVVVFGPGYGEAVAIHVGDGCWLLVDSCIDPQTKKPAPLTYLERIGVDVAQVRAIIATHWHDDHVRGISEVARVCQNAEFHLSGVFNQKEAVSLLAAYSDEVAPSLSRGTSELFHVMSEREHVYHLHHRTNVFEYASSSGQTVRVTALSPSQAATTQSIAHMAQYLPMTGANTGNVAELKPNIESVVLHFDLGEDAILLGSDLENHPKFGWTAIVNDAWSGSRRKSSAYKVAHHGSYTGHSDLVWEKMLRPNPVVAVTPFNQGSQRLPTEDDRARLVGRTANSYISSRAGRRPRMDAAILKRLSDIVENIAPVNSGFGAIRMRKVQGSVDWSVTCFGDAHKM